MPRDSGGTYTPPVNSWNPPVDGSIIDAPDWIAQLADYANAWTDSLSRSGQGGMLADLEVDANAISLTEISSPSSPAANNIKVYAVDVTGTSKLAYKDSAGTETVLGGGGAGDVVGPASATDGGFAKFDGTTGKLIKNSAAVVVVADGGMGSGTHTNHGVLIGAGTSAVTAASVGTNGQVLMGVTSGDPTFQGLNLSLTFIIDGGGSAITTGIKGDITIPFGATITEWTLLADQSGSIVIDIWKDTYANYPPTIADTITASAKPTISTATKGQSSTLTGWTTSITTGDTIRFNVDSVTSITRVTLSLKVTRITA